VPLRADVGSPFANEVDEVTWESDDDEAEEEDEEVEEVEEAEEPADAESDDDAEAADSADGDDDEAEGVEEEEERLIIDLEGFERRAVPLPVKAGSFRDMAVADSGALVYLRSTSRGFDGETTLQMMDVSADEPKEEVVLEGLAGFELTPDGTKILIVQRGGRVGLAGVSAGAKPEPVSTDGMRVMIDPRAEWRQIVRDAWRIHRDFFYVANMHGVDWPAIHDHYAAMLDDCVTRADVSFLIREMISELNVGHAYYYGGDTESADRVNVGMLGADFALENGAYRISEIIEGAAWDSDARGPLSQPGVDVAAGDYLLAVDGVPLDVSKDPWAAFQGLAGASVTLTVSSEPTDGEDSRDVVVELLGSESSLRYRHWVESRRRMAEELSDGAVGYIYVPDTGVDGQNELVRQFFSQIGKPALLIDDRWNGGGQIPTRFIELLNRPITNYWARRDGTDWPWPPDAHQGPKAMLINGLAGSGGDAFPAYFKQAGLGKLVGMRTWGGLVGISGNPGLIDGGYTAVPTFGYYDKDGTWGIEGHGVDPDILVVDDPALMRDGGDPQLAAAVEQLLQELQDKPYTPPTRPAAPDRSGMGVTESDK
jgi:tricorn protease